MQQNSLPMAGLPTVEPESRSTGSVSARKGGISTMLPQTISASAEVVPLNELLQILIGLASALSMPCTERKQAFVVRELLQRITPALVEAKKIGAAEMGIHPAANNASHSGFLPVEDGIKSLLKLIGGRYGTLHGVDDMPPVSSSENLEKVDLLPSRRRKSHAHGNFDLRVEILKSCIAISEALPDFEGILRYTIYLLKSSRRTVTLAFHEPTGTPAISQEEQRKLMDGIKRTANAAAMAGVKDIAANYWDEFLVRGIETRSPPAALRVELRSKNELQSDLEAEKVVKQDPFIYNPFSKSTSSTADQPLVAGDMAYFTVCLQNPYEMEVEIEEISLLAEGCGFQPSKHSIVLGHFCCQRFTLAGKPTRSGTLKIIGCKAKIRHCRERDFFIYSADWASKLTRPEAKTLLHATRDAVKSQLPSAAAEGMQKSAEAPRPGSDSDTLSVNVIGAQPVISVRSTTLSQPALMVLEGERKSFDIVLQNESNVTAVDVVLFTFEDSATSQLRTALQNKELAPTDQYELQLQLAGRPPFKHVAIGEKGGPAILAGGSAGFTIEVLGIPGLLNGIVQMDYAQLDSNAGNVKDKFYARQLSFPVAVTVNASIEVPRCNILPFSSDFAWRNTQRASISYRHGDDARSVVPHTPELRSASYTALQSDGGQFTSLLGRLGLGSHGHDHCLLLLDLRNVWPFPLSVSIQVRDLLSPSSSPTDQWRRAYTFHEPVQPGHVSRTVLLIPRIFVSDSHKPIPLIGNQRQFVVSTSKLSVEAEHAHREAFWYREEVLKYVWGTWREDSTGREGSIDLRRGIRLSAKMIEALRIEDIEIALTIKPSLVSDAQPSPVLQEGRSRFKLQTDSFVTLDIKVHNRASDELHVLLRIQPSLRNQPHTIALDLSRRLVWTGMLQRALHPPLAPDEVRETSLGIMALCAGEYEIAATIEELKTPGKNASDGWVDLSSRSTERRIWHAREPCLIDAVDSTQL
jgi:trafficking protein particle complex subunit 9